LEGQVGDEGTACDALAGDYETGILQGPQCLPDSHPADLEFLRQFPFGRQFVAGLEMTEENRLLELLRHFVGDSQGSYWCEHRHCDGDIIRHVGNDCNKIYIDKKISTR